MSEAPAIVNRLLEDEDVEGTIDRAYPDTYECDLCGAEFASGTARDDHWNEAECRERQKQNRKK